MERSAVAHPALHHVFDFARTPAERGLWHKTDDYFIWTTLRPAQEPPLTLWELRPEGVLRIPDSRMTFHQTPASTPHHFDHLFGYWRECDTDLVSVRAVQPEGVHYALVIGGKPGSYTRDAISWICPKCAHVLARFEVKTGPTGWSKLWEEEKGRVGDFNADRKLRICTQCGFEHPLAYPFDPNKDSPVEAEARKFW